MPCDIATWLELHFSLVFERFSKTLLFLRKTKLILKIRMDFSEMLDSCKVDWFICSADAQQTHFFTKLHLVVRTLLYVSNPRPVSNIMFV